MKLKSHWWWDLSALDFRDLDMSSIVAVLPVGAVEQHARICRCVSMPPSMTAL